VMVYIAVHDRGRPPAPAGWEKTPLAVRWELGADAVYRRAFSAGTVDIPPHPGRSGGSFGLPHLVFVVPASGSSTAGFEITSIQSLP
jgi:hypothetical protein